MRPPAFSAVNVRYVTAEYSKYKTTTRWDGKDEQNKLSPYPAQRTLKLRMLTVLVFSGEFNVSFQLSGQVGQHCTKDQIIITCLSSQTCSHRG